MPLRFGILLRDSQLVRWQVGCLQPLLELADVQPVVRIDTGRAGDAAGSPGPSNDRARADPAGSEALEERAPLPEDLVPLPAAIAALPRVPATNPRAILSHQLDFVLSFADDPGAAHLLESARWGVWRYAFGDWQRFRGAPVGYWEVHTGEPVSTAMLVRLTDRPRSVVVLREGYLRTSVLSPAKNRARLLGGFPHWPVQVCRDLLNGHTDRFAEAPLSSTGPERYEPTSLQRLVCAGRILGRMAAEGYRALFRHTQWNVGIAVQPISSFLSNAQRPRVRWLDPPQRASFRADPFGVMRDGRLTILLEDFSYATNRGTISAVDPSNGVELPVTIGPQPPVHLSYPYLLELEGRLLCIPEAHEAGEVALYEAARFPDRWRRVATLALEKVIVDATLFRHEDRWWIAGSEPGIKGESCELHLWYATDIGGPWRAHAANPVKIDVRSARPAGTPFHHEGALYRPAQDCSRSYGGRISLNRVTVLTPTAFREVVVGTVEPEATGPYGEGIHTLSRVGNLTLVDGKRTRFVFEEFLRVARHFLGKALSRAKVSSKPAPGAPPASG